MQQNEKREKGCCVVCKKPTEGWNAKYCYDCRAFLRELNEEFNRRMANLHSYYNRKLNMLYNVLPEEITEKWKSAQKNVGHPSWMRKNEPFLVYADNPLPIEDDGEKPKKAP